MNIIIVGINYAPEIVGIGPYTSGMAQFLVERGHAVTVICAKPYYPHWKVDPAYAGGGQKISVEHGVRVVRVPTYVPANPSGGRRLLHHISFAVRAQLALFAETRLLKPDVVIGIAPSLISTIAARFTAHRTGSKLWLHIQDFEVEAAFVTGLLKDKGFTSGIARRFESWAINADRVSTISPQMHLKLIEKRIDSNNAFELRNWASTDEVFPLREASSYRSKWKIDTQHVALYSGNIANKQGIEIVVEAAYILRNRKDLTFIVCGNGPNRESLIAKSAGLSNIRFYDLQSRENLSQLLGMASVHLLPQIAGAADLVLPSKLTNMLASGRPVVATAALGTGLAAEVEGCGLISTPGNAAAFARAIEQLIDDEVFHHNAGIRARERATTRWDRVSILSAFEKALLDLVKD